MKALVGVAAGHHHGLGGTPAWRQRSPKADPPVSALPQRRFNQRPHPVHRPTRKDRAQHGRVARNARDPGLDTIMSLHEQLPRHSDQQAYPAAAPPQRGTSGLAIAGLILAFLMAPIGFILSLIAVFKTGKGRSKGRGLAIAGLVVSTLIIAGVTTVVVLAANSTVADPGCIDGKAAIIANAGNVDPDALKSTAAALNAAAAKAEHDNVRAALTALATDYTQLLDAMKTGNIPAGLQDKVTADANTIDSLCTIGA
jgi:hypothetical protein